MAAPPARTEISDTYPNPSNAVARTGFGKLYDYVTGLLGVTGNASDARTALGLITGFAISLGGIGYIKLPTWLGGVVFQWGFATTAPAGLSVAFPLAFPNACFVAQATSFNTSGSGVWMQVVSKSNSSMYVQSFQSTSTLTATTFTWFAVGN